MKEFQERVCIENEKLDKKIWKLVVFMDSDTYDKLSLSEKVLINMQYHTMCSYSMILSERIRLFS